MNLNDFFKKTTPRERGFARGGKDAAAGCYTAGMGSNELQENRAEYRAGYEAGWDQADQLSTQNAEC